MERDVSAISHAVQIAQQSTPGIVETALTPVVGAVVLASAVAVAAASAAFGALGLDKPVKAEDAE